MAVCGYSGCRKVISKAEERRMVTKHNDAGQVTAVFHYKCDFIMRKRAREGLTSRGRYYEGTPTAYGAQRTTRDDLSEEEVALREQSEKEYETLRKRQQEIEEDRAQESVPEREEDWREPVTLEMEELIKGLPDEERQESV